jgi:hypothetical protein
LQDGCLEFERAKWYDTLILYGLKEGETEDGLKQDPDVKLVPTVIEKVLLPKLTRKCSIYFGICSENLPFLDSDFCLAVDLYLSVVLLNRCSNTLHVFQSQDHWIDLDEINNV